MMLLAPIVEDARKVLAELTEDQLAKLEGSDRQKAESRRHEAKTVLRRLEPLLNPQPPQGAEDAAKRLAAVRAEKEKIADALQKAMDDERAAHHALESARRTARKAAGGVLLGEASNPLAGAKKMLFEAMAAADIALLGREELNERLAEAEHAEEAARDAAAAARENSIQYEYNRAAGGYLRALEELIPTAAKIRAAASLLEIGVPEGVIGGNLFGIEFPMPRLIEQARAELLGNQE